MHVLNQKKLYHINSQANFSPYALMRPGEVVSVGATTNPFFRFYDAHQRTYRVTEANGQVTMVPAIHLLARVKEGTINPHSPAGDALEVAKHFMMLARELVWESVRLAEFPNEPSR